VKFLCLVPKNDIWIVIINYMNAHDFSFKTMHTIGLNIFDVTSDISNLSTISGVNSEIQQNLLFSST
jgi:hypothetical protein